MTFYSSLRSWPHFLPSLWYPSLKAFLYVVATYTNLGSIESTILFCGLKIKIASYNASHSSAFLPPSSKGLGHLSWSCTRIGLVLLLALLLLHNINKHRLLSHFSIAGHLGCFYFFHCYEQCCNQHPCIFSFFFLYVCNYFFLRDRFL